MILRGVVVAALATCCLLGGCASRSYAVLLPSPDGSVGAIVVTTSKGSVLVNKGQQAVALDGSTATPFNVADAKLQKDFGSALGAQPALPLHYQLYFNTGGADLTAESEAMIPSILATVRERGMCAISVIGHTDTAGDQENNEQLGLVRANAIANFLRKNGLQALELTVTSHGERNLLVKTPDNTPQPKNRRVEINVR